MRGRASLKCFVDLVKLFPLLSLWLCLCPFVSLRSTTLMQSGNDSFHWMFSSNGRSLNVPPPEALQIHTSNSPLLCSFHVSFLSPALIWVSPSFIWPLFSSFLQSAAVSSFVWFAVHTRKGGWDFCLTSVYFCSPRSPPRKTEGSVLVSWEELSLPDTRITNQWQRGKRLMP